MYYCYLFKGYRLCRRPPTLDCWKTKQFHWQCSPGSKQWCGCVHWVGKNMTGLPINRHAAAGFYYYSLSVNTSLFLLYVSIFIYNIYIEREICIVEHTEYATTRYTTRYGTRYHTRYHTRFSNGLLRSICRTTCVEHTQYGTTRYGTRYPTRYHTRFTNELLRSNCRGQHIYIYIYIYIRLYTVRSTVR